MNKLRYKGFMWPLLGVLLLISVPHLPLSPSWITTLSYIGIYALPALGIVIITGTAGMLSFGQASFMALAAYTTALTIAHLGWAPWAGLVAAWILTAGSAWVLGAITLSMPGLYLPIATLAWGFAVTLGLANFDFTGRNDGLGGIPPISLGSISLQSQTAIYYFIWLIVIVALLLVRNFLDSRPGRATRALMCGRTMPESMGIDTNKTKRVAFVLAAFLAGTAGWLYAHMVRAISPSAFGPHYSLEFVFMAVIGGASSIGGAIAGAGIVVLAKDMLQSYLPQLIPVRGNFEVVVLGIAMVILLVKTREGAWTFLMRKLGSAGHRVKIPVSGMELARSKSGGASLSVKSVIKRFGGLVAVKEVSLDVKPGEIVALIGPNGAGKSTTFNLITGVLSADQGEVIFNGEPITNLGSREIARRGIYRTFQHVKLVPNMSVVENIAIGAHLSGRGSATRSMFRLDRKGESKILYNAAEQARRVGLGDLLHAPAGTLSLGQQRLIEIARALSGNPSLLLLDEPAAGLRYVEKVALSNLLSELKSDGVSVLVVEHDMQFVMGLVDRIFVLDFGTLIAQGSPGEIQSSEAVKRAYLGVE